MLCVQYLRWPSPYTLKSILNQSHLKTWYLKFTVRLFLSLSKITKQYTHKYISKYFRVFSQNGPSQRTLATLESQRKLFNPLNRLRKLDPGNSVSIYRGLVYSNVSTNQNAETSEPVVKLTKSMIPKALKEKLKVCVIWIWYPAMRSALFLLMNSETWLDGNKVIRIMRP